MKKLWLSGLLACTVLGATGDPALNASGADGDALGAVTANIAAQQVSAVVADATVTGGVAGGGASATAAAGGGASSGRSNSGAAAAAYAGDSNSGAAAANRMSALYLPAEDRDCQAVHTGHETPLDDLFARHAAREAAPKLDYWESHYASKGDVLPPSSFAEFIASKHTPGKLVEFGCGDGRDSLFFARNGFNVIATDGSSVVIEKNNARGEIPNLAFQVVDVSRKEALATLPKVSYYYARFFMHSIPEDVQTILLDYLRESDEGTHLFLEFRTDKDPLFQKSTKISATEGVTDHYRRFINFEDFSLLLKRLGFEILFQQEADGLSVHGDDNPVLARFVAKKMPKWVPHQFNPDLPVALYQLVHDFQTIMDHHQIPFFFSFGTLLGAVRHGGLIPWDDDADCCLLEENINEFMLLGIPSIAHLGYEIHFVNEDTRRGIFISAFDKKWKKITFLDVFFMKQSNKKYVVLGGWPEIALKEEQIYPLQKVRFGNLTISAPNDIKDLFDQFYGPNWKTHIRRYNHLFGTHEEDFTEASSQDLLPAGPFTVVDRSIIPHHQNEVIRVKEESQSQRVYESILCTISILSGFSELEANGFWLTGRVTFTVDKTCTNSLLKILFLGKIISDDIALNEYSLEDEDGVVVPLNGERRDFYFIHQGDKMQYVLKMATRSPRALGINEDDRNLSFFLRGIKIEKIS